MVWGSKGITFQCKHLCEKVCTVFDVVIVDRVDLYPGGGRNAICQLLKRKYLQIICGNFR